MSQLKETGNVQVQPKQGGNRSITIGGDVTNGVLTVGDNNNINVNFYSSAQQPKTTERLAPVIVGRPAKSVVLLDREAERQIVQNAVASEESVEFYATEGFGKTALMRSLAVLLQLPNGMVYLSAKNRSLDDLLYILFDKFYECDQTYRPLEYSGYFENTHALIILDDVTLTRDEIQNLLSTLPGCVFILSSQGRHLWEQGSSVHLSGLPTDAAVDLFQSRVERTLSDDEKVAIAKICDALQNNPLHIIQAAAVGNELREAPSANALYDQVLASVPESEKAVLALLAAVSSAPLPVEHIAAILDNKDLAPILDDLMQRGLVEAHSPRYSVVEGFGQYLAETWNVSEWHSAVLRYFVNWTARPFSNDQVLDVVDALLAIMENAAAQGRWREILQIGSAIESAFIFNGQWTIWNRLLQLLLQAARALGNRFTEAWVLHQMGSRALCLNDAAQARELLTRALEIRKTIGDKVGIKATQHNLQQLIGGTGAPKKGCRQWLACGGVMVLVLMGIVAVAVFLWVQFNSARPTSSVDVPTTSSDIPVTTPSFTQSVTPTSTFKATDTLTPSATPTFTFTPTKIFTLTPVPVWHDWEPVGGSNIRDVAVSWWGTNRLDVIARDGEDQIHHMSWNGSSWSGWEKLESLDCSVDSGPGAVSWGANRIDIFVRCNGDLLHMWWSNSWSTWENLGYLGYPGDESHDAVTVSSWGTNRLDVFARGESRQLYHFAWNGSSWIGPEDLGGILISPPSAVSWGTNRIDIFGVGLDAQVWHKWWDNGWYDWEPVGGSGLQDVAVSSRGTNRLDVFARGGDNQLYHMNWNGSNWSSWENLGGILISPPSAVSGAADRIDVFGVGLDEQVWHKWYGK